MTTPSYTTPWDTIQEGGFELLIRALEKGLGTIGQTRLKPGTVFRDIDASWCPEMVVLPGGEFLMGSPEDEEGAPWPRGPTTPSNDRPPMRDRAVPGDF